MATDKTSLDDSTTGTLNLNADHVVLTDITAREANELLDSVEPDLAEALNAALDYFNLEEADTYLVLRITKG